MTARKPRVYTTPDLAVKMADWLVHEGPTYTTEDIGTNGIRITVHGADIHARVTMYKSTWDRVNDMVYERLDEFEEFDAFDFARWEDMDDEEDE